MRKVGEELRVSGWQSFAHQREAERLRSLPGGAGRAAFGAVHREAVEVDQRDSVYPNLAALLKRAEGGAREEGAFIRFGDLPEGGRSSRGWRGLTERGVSCFAATKTPAGHYILDARTPGRHYEIVWLVRGEGRPAYVLRGLVVGYGDAAEPLLRVRHAEPLPQTALLAVAGGSYALDMWNIRRFGDDQRLGTWLEDVPELAYLFEDRRED